MNGKRDRDRDGQYVTPLDSAGEHVDGPEYIRIADGGAEVADERPDRDADIEVYVDELAGRDPSQLIGYRSTTGGEGSDSAESDAAGEAMATLIEGLKSRVELTEYSDESVLALVWLDEDHQINYVEWNSPELDPDASDTGNVER